MNLREPRKLLVGLLAGVFILTGCGDSASKSQPTPTVSPTQELLPTLAPVPTSAVSPTQELFRHWSMSPRPLTPLPAPPIPSCPGW